MARRLKLRAEDRAGVIARVLREGDNATCFYAACGAGVTEEQVRALYRRVRMTGDPSWVERFHERFPAGVLGEQTRESVRARRRHGGRMQECSAALIAALSVGVRQGEREEAPDWETTLRERLGARRPEASGASGSRRHR